MTRASSDAGLGASKDATYPAVAVKAFGQMELESRISRISGMIDAVNSTDVPSVYDLLDLGLPEPPAPGHPE